MNYFALTPQDAWFFRDGRPYNHGESNQADVESLFPPPARTLTGALRAALARANGWDGKRGGWPCNVTEAFGDGPSNLGQLQFAGPFLIRQTTADQGEALWPLPRHLLGRIESDKWTPKAFLHPAEQPTETDCGRRRLPEIPRSVAEREGLKPAESSWVTLAGLNDILAGRLPAANTIFKPADLWRAEARIGLKRDATTKTVGEGDLYSPTYVRLCRGISLGVGFSGLPAGMNNLPGLFPLGGESRLAQAGPWPGNPLPNVPAAKSFQADMNGKVRFIAVLLTPGRFDTGQPLVEDVELLSACIGKPLLIGGWDSLKHQPLPLEPFVPAGSVWFFEAAADRLPGVLELHGRWIGQHTAHGFGQIAIGVWPFTNNAHPKP